MDLSPTFNRNYPVKQPVSSLTKASVAGQEESIGLVPNVGRSAVCVTAHKEEEVSIGSTSAEGLIKGSASCRLKIRRVSL